MGKTVVLVKEENKSFKRREINKAREIKGIWIKREKCKEQRVDGSKEGEERLEGERDR